MMRKPSISRLTLRDCSIDAILDFSVGRRMPCAEWPDYQTYVRAYEAVRTEYLASFPGSANDFANVLSRLRRRFGWTRVEEFGARLYARRFVYPSRSRA